MSNIDNTQDIIDVRDIIAQVENLAASIEYCAENSEVDPDEKRELDELRALLADLAGCGGDEQWEGDWYPVTLIRDDYFEAYAGEIADEIGTNFSDAVWPFTCIDWERAAREFQMDYTSVEYDGVTYWYR